MLEVNSPAKLWKETNFIWKGNWSGTILRITNIHSVLEEGNLQYMSGDGGAVEKTMNYQQQSKVGKN